MNEYTGALIVGCTVSLVMFAVLFIVDWFKEGRSWFAQRTIKEYEKQKELEKLCKQLNGYSWKHVTEEDVAAYTTRQVILLIARVEALEKINKDQADAELREAIEACSFANNTNQKRGKKR